MDIYTQKRENKSLTSLIFEKIREDILNNKYEDGEKIVEAKLAEKFGVSRTPVREALKQLELDGLVENIPNRGAIVKGIQNEDIHDIYEIRSALEAIAIKWAMNRISDAKIKELQEIYELMEFYTLKNNTEKVFELNTQFHELIYHSTKSRYLEQMLNEFQLFIKSTRNRSLKTEGRLKEAIVEHKRIVDAFLKRDIEEGIAAIQQHIENSQKNAQKFCKVVDEEDRKSSDEIIENLLKK